MHDAQLMEVGDARDDMLEKPACLKFIQFGLFDDEVE